MKRNIIFILLILVVGSLIYIYSAKTKNLPSREVLERAENVVREKKPTPTQSSRFYAIVSKEYFNRAFQNKKGIDNLSGVRDTNFKLENFSTSSLQLLADEIVKQENIENEKIKLLHRVENWDDDKKPFSPGATNMERFVLDNNFSYQTPTPPVYKSADFYKGLEEVKNASEKRNMEQNAAINFWGGIPGTQAPAGIWQDRLFEITKKYNLSDKDYAYAQMILAQAVADSFMECWKVKYIYQTKRPDMTDKSIVTAMANPPFPSYVSGHSTISFTAATVLSQMFPGDIDVFFRDAEQAKNSRLWAGIHFPYDNEEGEKLGIEVGKFVNQKLSIARIK